MLVVVFQRSTGRWGICVLDMLVVVLQKNTGRWIPSASPKHWSWRCHAQRNLSTTINVFCHAYTLMEWEWIPLTTTPRTSGIVAVKWVSMITNIAATHQPGHPRLHLSLNRWGCLNTTDDFSSSFLHFSLFSTALWDLANSRLVHSLTLSFQFFFCLPCLLSPFTVPCKVVFARPDWWQTCISRAHNTPNLSLAKMSP